MFEETVGGGRSTSGSAGDGSNLDNRGKHGGLVCFEQGWVFKKLVGSGL